MSEKIVVRIEVKIGDVVLEAEDEYTSNATWTILVASAKRGLEKYLKEHA